MSVSDILKTISEPLNKLLVPVASSAGTTLQDAWELVFGGFGTYVEKKRITRAHDLMEFKSSLEAHVAAIPENQLCEPKLSIVGPALEASKYYFEEPELREMFAKLISSSMDCSKVPSVHPSFTEIIKQMSPLDAQNLSCIDHTGAVAEYRLRADDGGYYSIASNIFLGNPSVTDLIAQSQSLSSLERLGLVHITYQLWILEDDAYVGFDQTSLYLDLASDLQEDPRGTLTFQKGMVSITPLGSVFKNICLD